MSTNAVIQVEGIDFVELYKHFDGYPEATLPWLKEFNKSFTEERGDDPEYKFAQLVRSSAYEEEKYNLDGSKTTGWGVFPLNCVGFEFKYILKSDGSVEVEED